MKKKNIIKSLLLGTVATTLLITTVYAAGAAGSSDDPLVTKSYVDTQISSILNTISSSNSNTGNGTISEEVEKDLVETVTKNVLAIISATSNDSTNTSTGSSQSYVPVELQSGQILVGDEGTEIILRSGSALSYVNSANGIVNATTGGEYMDGISIPKNNILIVPRNDGRGVRAINGSAWFIVKGGYTIK